MHRRYQRINIPIEIVRTVVEIAESGSYTKAGERLLLSQPAISAQIKRLQTLIGGQIFEKTANGLKPTAKGELILVQARRILESNDQILSLGGAVRDARPVRVGLSNVYAEQFCALHTRWMNGFAEPISVHCDESSELARCLADGYIDIACMLRPPPGFVVEEWDEPFVWARAPHFVLSPGAPIPIVSLIQDVSSSVAVEALERAGLAYRIRFESPDLYARVAAVAAGMGLMALPSRNLPTSLVVAKEYYLPALQSPKAGICVRNGVRGGPHIDVLMQTLSLLNATAKHPPQQPVEQIKSKANA
jgi:DNA-binding transcriptional LysR family regulator